MLYAEIVRTYSPMAAGGGVFLAKSANRQDPHPFAVFAFEEKGVTMHDATVELLDAFPTKEEAQNYYEEARRSFREGTPEPDAEARYHSIRNPQRSTQSA